MEVVIINLLHPHPRLGEAHRLAVAPIGLLDILAQGKLDEGIRIGDLHLLRGHAPTELDDAALASDRVGRTVQDLTRCHPASQVAVDVDVL